MADFGGIIGQELPYLRRYARALTGSQQSGDAFAAATLEAILADNSVFRTDLAPRTALFRAFHAIWSSAGAPVAEQGADTLERRALVHLRGLTRNTREALLLHTIEDLGFAQVGEVMDIPPAEAEALVNIALREMEGSVLGSVMVIEDETIIALDLQSIVGAMGHRVTGIARTRDEARALGRKARPDLVLSDIQLADGSSGIDAVNDLLSELGAVPVIFITAFPERLLTGERPEPTFLITKPFQPETVKAAIGQALFFHPRREKAAA